MSIMSSLGNFFKNFGETVLHALGYANTHGLTDAVIEAAKQAARQAALEFADNAARQAYVKQTLQTTFHLSDSIANLAVELGVMALKAEAGKL